MSHSPAKDAITRAAIRDEIVELRRRAKRLPEVWPQRLDLDEEVDALVVRLRILETSR
jgi:hypothetical protein